MDAPEATVSSNGIKVNNNKVNGMNVILFQFPYIRFTIKSGQNSAKNLGVKGFYPATQNGRISGQ